MDNPDEYYKEYAAYATDSANLYVCVSITADDVEGALLRMELRLGGEVRDYELLSWRGRGGRRLGM